MESLEKIKIYLQYANQHGLQAEVVYFALKYIQANPNKSIDDAMAYGYYECCK